MRVYKLNEEGEETGNNAFQHVYTDRRVSMQEKYDEMVDNFKPNAGKDSIVFEFRMRNKCGTETDAKIVQYFYGDDYVFRQS